MRSPSKYAVRNGLIVVLAVLAAAPAAKAQVGAPATAPTTLWNFLGIPYGIRKLQGATRNRNGNRPNREPKPPLKAIADPRNLESKDPSIKKAAEIKQAEDLKKQKIKAVKYLAGIGCGCYDVDGGVTAALVASMGDCTEDVRYETINAITEAAEEGCCANCGSTCCCNKDILTAMAKIAYERDDHGCYVEPSERVREAAVEGLRACCPNDSPPVIVTPPVDDDTIPESAEEVEEGAEPESTPEGVEPTPPAPPTAPDGIEPLPSGAALYHAPEAPGEAARPLNSGISAPAPEGFGYGVVIDVSPAHGLAHIHFDDAAVDSPVGGEVGVYQQIGAERRLAARLQIVATFPGSAHVTGSPDALAAIARGDLVLRPTALAAEPQAPVVASTPLVEPTEPSPPADADTAWIEPLPPVESSAEVATPTSAPSEPVLSAPGREAATEVPMANRTPAPAPSAPARPVEPAQAAAAAAAPAVQTAVQPATGMRPVAQPQRQVRQAVARRPVAAVFMP